MYDLKALIGVPFMIVIIVVALIFGTLYFSSQNHGDKPGVKSKSMIQQELKRAQKGDIVNSGAFLYVVTNTGSNLHSRMIRMQTFIHSGPIEITISDSSLIPWYIEGVVKQSDPGYSEALKKFVLQ
ncbi:hypothetical protein HY967_00120 [Candidatus Jorgensenbacteria bacterium]|nr:hypothetical protein [Candidatus Jorgensenbacteria bacterium]